MSLVPKGIATSPTNWVPASMSSVNAFTKEQHASASVKVGNKAWSFTYKSHALVALSSQTHMFTPELGYMATKPQADCLPDFAEVLLDSHYLICRALACYALEMWLVLCTEGGALEPCANIACVATKICIAWQAHLHWGQRMWSRTRANAHLCPAWICHLQPWCMATKAMLAT